MEFKELLHSLDGELAAYKCDESSQITGIEDRISGIRGSLVSRQALKTERHRDLKNIEEEVARRKEQLSVSKNKAEQATIFRQTLSGFSQGWPRSITVWNKGHLIASGASLVAGILMALLISDTISRIVAGGAGTISALVFFVLARRTEIVFEGQSSADFVRQIKEQWKARTGEELGAETVEGISDIFNRCISTYDSEVMYCENKDREIGKLEGLIKGIETEMESMTQEIRKLEDERERWLKDRHVAGRDDYISKIGTYRRIHTEVESKRSLLKGKYGEKQAFDDVQREIERKLRVMDEEGVQAKGMHDEERQQGKIRLDRLKREIEGIGKEINSASIGNAGLMGGIRSKLEDLNREILELQQREIPDLNRRISEIELLKKAAGMAFEIFEEIRKDTGLIFDSLALEIGSLMGSVHGDERIVQIKGLKDEDIKMEDASGDHRYIGNLSTGTQDVFSFAARLALAKKSADGQWRPLLLDEPFLYMDQHRTKNALKLLKTFQEETRAQGAEWQIMLFTKEAELRDLAKETFPDADVHELAVGSTEKTEKVF